MLDWKRRPRSKLRTTAQLREITARSLPPRDCQLLPMLESPAGYICVIRDIDSDVYRIDSTDHPATYVDALLGEMTGSYGIELLSILKTENIGASESQLFEAHHARLSDEWLDLDDHQLAELRRSDLKIYAYRSLYPRPRSESAPRSAASERSASRDSRSAPSTSRRTAARARPLTSRSWRLCSNLVSQLALDLVDYDRSSVRLIGQWSLPMTSAWISAATIFSSRSGEMKK